ncbi:serine hydrolase domain-containing protein [Rufibacter immobilis]|nr:serine hydrolase [Rufibacter immobilis]
MTQFCLLVGLMGSLSCSTYGQKPAEKSSVQWLQQQKEVSQTTVLLNNAAQQLPLKNLEQKIASVSIGSAPVAAFDSLASFYAAVEVFPAVSANQANTFQTLQNALAPYQTVLVQVAATALKDAPTIAFLLELQKRNQLVLSVFGKPDFLKHANFISAPMVWSEQETPVAGQYAAQLVFGGMPAVGTLANTYSEKYTKGAGFKTTATRLSYTVPEAVGINSEGLQTSMDAIVQEAIREKAAPGAVVLVAKSGKVILNKAYGSHTYDTTRATKITDIFDLASLTKISATTVAAMQLYDQQKLSLEAPLGTYVPSARNTTKADLTLRNVLLHQAGLPAGVVFPVQPQDASKTSSPHFTVRTADSLFLRKDYYREVMWPRILNARMGVPGKYVYSDLTMFLMQEVVEGQTGKRLDTLVQEQFYQPLGMQTAGFLPLNRFEKSRIVPTEFDSHFRKELLQGYVHDGGAARAGGVAGHAGLFSTANDLAILYQMLLNGGAYGGKRYIQPETVQLFTRKHSDLSRRGLGFDRWDPDSTQGYPAKLASPETYGHTGYTGTCVWVDPKNELVFVFLSNRVHPKVSNKLLSLRTRQRALDAVYQAIQTSDKTKVAAVAQP